MNNAIQSILYDIFSENAIIAASISEQLTDIKYCTEHGMNHLDGDKENRKWEAEMQRAKKTC